mgnify:CR=1 FL=1
MSERNAWPKATRLDPLPIDEVLSDVTAALEALADPLPPADRYESNDDAGTRAATTYGRERTMKATLDF